MILMILMQANPFRGQLEGMGTENQDLFGPWNGNEQNECYLGPKKSQRASQIKNQLSQI